MHKIIIEKIKIPYLNKERTIRIYLPPNYDLEKEFPVIYMHDAQNLFDIETSSYGAIWDVHDHMNHYYEKYQQGVIVVGIDNYEGRHNRLDEYSPWINTEIKNLSGFEDITEDVGGLGNKYVDFLVNVLKPYIDNHYKTMPSRENTSIIGSSMGGLISLYAIATYPEVFSHVGAFSTAAWFAENELISYLEAFDYNHPIKWYVDVGMKESENETLNDFYMKGTKRIYEVLSQNVSDNDRKLVIDKDGIHNEKDWSKRFFESIEFLLN